jgi:hypothetical protein
MGRHESHGEQAEARRHVRGSGDGVRRSPHADRFRCASRRSVQPFSAALPATAPSSSSTRRRIMTKQSVSSARAAQPARSVKPTKKTARSRRATEPSTASLRQIPEMDVEQAVRRNPYAARIARDGYSVHILRGRPRKGTETGPTVTKSVRLPPEVWSRLHERAEAAGIPLHALLRQALLAWLERVA